MNTENGERRNGTVAKIGTSIAGAIFICGLIFTCGTAWQRLQANEVKDSTEHSAILVQCEKLQTEITELSKNIIELKEALKRVKE